MTDQEKINKMAEDICRVKHNCNDACNPINTCNALKYARRAYEAGYRKQEWISVNERLPEEGTRVLGYDYMGNVVCYFVYGTRWWVGDGWNSAKGWGVTHWMPLPEPPENT